MYKAIDRWLPGYVKSVLERRPFTGTRHLYFAVADHFEPLRGGISQADSRRNVQEWLARYEKHFDGIRAADGSRPKQTLFYPAEEYDPAVADALRGFRDKGLGDVEIHLHHRNDTEDGLRDKLVTFRDNLFHKHGLLRKERVISNQYSVISREKDQDLLNTDNRSLNTGRTEPPVQYGFVHGNWALCNTRPDGDWCGVDNEIAVLKETGCYADFTFPSAPSPTQPRVVNKIYYAADKQQVISHQSSVTSKQESEMGRNTDHRSLVTDNSLLLITGPLCLDFSKRKYGFLPGLENGNIDGANPATPHRADLWAGCGIHAEGRPDRIFVKVHTHGLVPANAGSLFGGSLLDTYRYMLSRYDDGINWKLHFVSCYEMYEAIGNRR